MAEYILVGFVAFFVAGLRDATKSWHKYWVVGNLMLMEGLTFDQALHKYDTEVWITERPDFYSHSNGWHWWTSLIWILFIGTTAIVTGDVRYLFLYLDFLQLDMNYYIFEYFLSKGRRFLPNTLNWLTVKYGKIFGMSFRNPLNLIFGDEFTKKEFVIFWLILKVISYTLTYLTVT